MVEPSGLAFCKERKLRWFDRIWKSGQTLADLRVGGARCLGSRPWARTIGRTKETVRTCETVSEAVQSGLADRSSNSELRADCADVKSCAGSSRSWADLARSMNASSGLLEKVPEGAKKADPQKRAAFMERFQELYEQLCRQPRGCDMDLGSTDMARLMAPKRRASALPLISSCSAKMSRAQVRDWHQSAARSQIKGESLTHATTAISPCVTSSMPAKPSSTVSMRIPTRS